MIEKPITSLPLASLLLGILLATVVPTQAQESLVGIGSVYNGGGIQYAASPIGATITCTNTATGSSTITFAAPGAFAGATESDFIVHTTIDTVQPTDRASHGYVTSVTADLLTIKIRVSDLEDMTVPDLAVPGDTAFYFSVHRLDGLSNGISASSRHLIAAGTVHGNGTLESGFGLGGIAVSMSRWDTGRYFLHLGKTGAFIGDSHSHYVLILSSRSIALPDVAVSGGSWNANSDDAISFQIQGHDMQQAPASNNVVKANASFSFLVYRISSTDATGTPASNLLAATASVDGSTGDLVKGFASFPGSTVTSTRISTGRYRLTIKSTGAFAGVDANRYAPFVTPNETLHIDEIAKARVSITDADTLTVDITCDDVQHNDDPDGIDADASFFLSLYDTAPLLRHDLTIGKNASGAGAKGTNVFNKTGAAQTLVVPLKGTKRKSTFYRTANSGKAIDDLKLKSGRIPRMVDAQFTISAGTTRNITGQVKTGAVAATSLLPGDTTSVKASFRYRKSNKRSKTSILLTSLSGTQPANQDTNRAMLKPR